MARVLLHRGKKILGVVALCGAVITHPGFGADTASAKTYVLKAPARQLSIVLGPTDPPADVVLRGWYCTHPEDLDAATKVDPRKSAEDLIKGEISARVHPGHHPDPKLAYYLAQNVNWGYNIRMNIEGFRKWELQESPIMRKLDAPPGKTVIYKRKYCLTKIDTERLVKWTANYVTMYMWSIINSMTRPPYNDKRKDVIDWITNGKKENLPPPIFKVPRPKPRVLIVKVTRRPVAEKKIRKRQVDRQKTVHRKKGEKKKRFAPVDEKLLYRD